MPEVWAFVLASLAVLGGAWGIAKDDISESFRNWLWCQGWERYPWPIDKGIGEDIFEQGGARGVVARWTYKLASCPFCVGAWLCVFATAALLGWDVLSVRWWLVFWGLRGANVVLTALLLRILDS